MSMDVSSDPAHVYVGEVFHARLQPQRHSFRYRVSFFSFDIDRLHELKSSSWLLGHNVFRPFTIRDRDYLPGAEGDLRAKLRHHLQLRGEELPEGKIELITVPKFFGYVFNPVSFYRCFNPSGELRLVIAEVNNTFGETHLYVLPANLGKKDCDRDTLYAREKKEFHVSPFLDRRGEYLFSFQDSGPEKTNKVDLRVDLEKNGETVFVSRLHGEGRPVNSVSLLDSFMRRPFAPWLAGPRIALEAVKMRFAKKFEVFPRPIADSPDTIRRSSPAYLDQASRYLIRRSLRRIKKGTLVICYPDGEIEKFGEKSSELVGRILVRNTNVFSRVLFAGDIGFGESYMAGEWDSDNLTSVFEIFVANVDSFNDRKLVSTFLGQIQNRLLHGRRENSQTQSRKNISDHYDLSNQFFAKFLDPSMSYSSAIYRNSDDTLEQAQQNKIEVLLTRAKLEPGMRVLEIGSGWGSLAIRAAEEYGVTVTGITLSKEQRVYAANAARERGVSDKVSFIDKDYREMTGQFDRIISVEMLEAVGHKYYKDYFRACERLLAPGGLLVLQVITIPEQAYGAYIRSCDWIQKYIFPGGETPSLEALLTAARKHSRLIVESVDNIGDHYARTLKDWRRNFDAERKAIGELGFPERFQRMWEYYLCYCEAAFSTRYLGTLQLVMTRPGNLALDSCPGYDKPPL